MAALFYGIVMFILSVFNLMFMPVCVENIQMFDSIRKVNNVYYQITGLTSVVYDDSRTDDIYIKNGRVRVRSCGRYLEYRARPLVQHCTTCGN